MHILYFKQYACIDTQLKIYLSQSFRQFHTFFELILPYNI
jgi:hypothetical protein